MMIMRLGSTMPYHIHACRSEFFKWVRIFPEIDWYHNQGTSPAPLCIVWHQSYVIPRLMKTTLEFLWGVGVGGWGLQSHFQHNCIVEVVLSLGL